MQEIKIDDFGTKFYYWNGQLHREGSPAIAYANGRKEWLIHGQFHREDGPAVEWANGHQEWWIQGKSYSEEEYERVIKLQILI